MPNGSAPGARIGVLLALVSLGVVPGGEAERQVSHALNGTHRRPVVRSAGHAVSEPGRFAPISASWLWIDNLHNPHADLAGERSPAKARQANLYCGRREQADFYAAGRLGADRGVRAAAVAGDGAVCVAGARPDVRHARRGRRQGGRRHRGHRRPPDVGASEHDHGVPARRPDAGAGADPVDVGPRAAGSARSGLSAGQVEGRDRPGQQHRLQDAPRTAPSTRR